MFIFVNRPRNERSSFRWCVYVYVVLTINYGALCTQIVCLFLNYSANRNANKFLCDVSRLQILVLVLELLLYDRNYERYIPTWHSWALGRQMYKEKFAVGNVFETKNNSLDTMFPMLKFCDSFQKWVLEKRRRERQRQNSINESIY